jgi:O-antigen/teichoic acid export membrane protein
VTVAPREADSRQETETERLDRNWSELLQEVRVTQTGVQLLTGFLLTLPFQQRFTILGTTQLDIYLADVTLALIATTLLVAPVLMHRLLFRRHQRGRTVGWAHRCAIAGAGMFGLALIGVATLIFDIVAGAGAASAAGAVVAVVVLALWVVAPWRVHRRTAPYP